MATTSLELTNFDAMLFNLARLAESLLPLIDADGDKAAGLANDRLAGIAAIYRQHWLAEMRRKLGLAGEEAGDLHLAEDFLAAIAGADFTLAFRRLAGVDADETGYLALFADSAAIRAWLPRWRARRAGPAAGGPDAAAGMARANPAVIPRNHQVEAALAAATAGDMAPFTALLAAVRDPFGPETGREGYALPAPAGFGRYVTYCGT